MAPNFTSDSPSIDKALAADAAYGSFSRALFGAVNNTTTAATITCGYVTAQRFNIRPVCPSVGAGVLGYIGTNISAFTEDSNTTIIAGIEYLLGSINLSGNVFTAGVSMPQKKVKGSALLNTAAGIAFANIRTTLTATTPTISITYTDQAGNTGVSSSIQLPTNSAVNSSFLIQPHLNQEAGGIRAITGLSRNTGTAGIIDIYGLLPIYISHRNVALYETNLLENFAIPWLIEPGDYIGFYRLFSNTTCDACIIMNLVPEPI